MSLLNKAAVNPMTQPHAMEPEVQAPVAPQPTWTPEPQAAPAPAPAATAWQAPPEACAAQFAAQAAVPVLTAPQPAQNLPAPVAETLPAQRTATFDPDAGGFTCLQTGFGSFPRIKVNRGKYEIDDKPFATSFVCNIFDARDMFVYRDRDDDDKNTRVLWSYDQKVTSAGELVQQEIAKWEAEGFMDHDMKRYVEAVATVTSCPEHPEVEGQVVLLSIPPTSEKRLAGYQVVLKRTRSKFIPEVLTLIKADTIASSTRTWDAWVFSFAGLA